jgi:transposase
MGYYVGLDVSLKTTQICVVDDERQIVWRGAIDTKPEMIAERLERLDLSFDLVGLETGSLTPWLYHSLKQAGLPVVCMDARRAADAVRSRPEKTDKADARSLAEMLACSWYGEVYVKSLDSHRHKALLGARDQLVRVKRQLYGQVRGLLRPFGIRIFERAGAKRFDEEARAVCRTDDILYVSVAALLDALASVTAQIAVLDKAVRQIVTKTKACWHMMSVPGVGPITALAFSATIEDPHRFRRSRSVGAYLGLTPKRYQSGERDITFSISRQGDEMARHYLYEAANCLLTTVRSKSSLKSWGLKLVRRIGQKKARTAVARKLAVVLLGIWKREGHFEPVLVGA